MLHRSPIPALLLLAAFVAGGLVAPAVHQIEHGLLHHAEAEAAAAQDDHVHTDYAAFSVALDRTHADSLCLLCVPVSYWLAPVPSAPGFFTDSAGYALAPPERPAWLLRVLLPIRGPPAA